MTKLHLIPISLAGLLFTTACAHEHNPPSAPSSLAAAPGGLTAGGLETPETLRPCDGHDLPFLIALQGAVANPDFPGLNRVPVLVADPVTNPVTLSRTKWVNAKSNDWTQALGRDLDAISLGLDWLPLEHDLDDVSGEVVSWSPKVPLEGFASILFVQEDAVWAYSWGTDLVKLFPSDWTTFSKSEVELHARTKMITPIGGTVTGLDFNGGFQGAWKPEPTCFSPPGPALGTQATLFYSLPGKLLYTSMATAEVPPPGGSLTWSWSPGTPVELLLGTASGEVPLFPEGSNIDLVAFSYDRFNGIVMYSTSDEMSAPFMVADVTEGVSAEGVVVQLVLTNNQPLLDHFGEPLGESFSARPSGSCGIDPRRILGWRLPPRQLQTAAKSSGCNMMIR